MQSVLGGILFTEGGHFTLVQSVRGDIFGGGHFALLHRQEMGKIPNFTDSERFETPKTDCMLKFYKDKEFYQLGFQVC